MPYRMKPAVPLLVIKDQSGRLHHHYNQGVGGSISYCPVIHYLNEEQREHFLRLGLVEEIADESVPVQPAPAPSEPVPGPNAEIVEECVAALDRLEVPSDAGAPTARTALRENGLAFGNDTIAASVRERKMRIGG